MNTHRTASSPPTAVLAVVAALLASIPASARAATWTNQAGGYWLDTNNWSNLDVPRGGGSSGEANFSTIDWTTTGQLVVTTDSTPVSPETALPRFRNILFNDTGAAPDATLKITGTNPLVFYHQTAGSHPWIAPNGGTVVRLDVGIESQNTNTLQINCGDNTSKVYLDKQQASISYIRMTRGSLYLNGGNNTLPTNTIVMMDSTTAAWFALNGTTQEVAGLVAGNDNARRIVNDSASTGQLIVNVPAGTTHSFRGRIGYAGNNPPFWPEQNTFGVIKRGAGTQFISKQISSFTGPMVVEEGVLAIDNDGNNGPGTDPALGTLGSNAGDTTVNAGATLNIQGLSAIFLEPLVLKGDGVGGIGALRFSGDGTGTAGVGVTWNGPVTLGANATIYVDATNNNKASFIAGFTDNGAGYGFTKSGGGALIVAGSVNVTGASSVNEGTLTLGAGSLLESLTIASGATLGVTNSVTVNSLTFNSGTAVLNIGYGDVAGVNPTGAAINNTTLANNATVTVNVTGSGFTTTGVTPIVLLDYGTKSGSGSFIKGTLPPGIVGTITDNGSQIVLNITAAVNDLVWSGTVSGNWDLSTKNWNSGATNYQQSGGVGDIVKFQDGASTFSVNVTTTVTPALMTVNSGNAYTFSGSGKISGGVQVRKEGYGALAINNANDYSGGTLILNGAVQAGNNAALGQGTIYLNEFAVPQPLSLIVLSSDGASARTLTNSVFIAAANNTPNVATLGDAVNNGSLTFSGPVDFLSGITHNVTLASDVTFSGGVVSGGMNKYGQGTWTVTGAPANFTRGFDVRDGRLIFSSVNVTNTGDVRADAENSSLGFARVVVTNSAVLVCGGNLRLGDTANGAEANNFFDVSATCIVPNGGIVMNRNNSTYSEFNLLTGGDVTLRSVSTGGTATYPTRFNFNGGTLRAAVSIGTFMQGLTEAYIENGGATIDTAGYNIDIVQALLAGGGTGGLTKNGAGQLTLQGTNTFTGNIQVNEGGLTLYSAHQGSGSVTCVDGTTFGMNSSGTNLVVNLSSVTLGSATGGTLRARFGGGQSGSPTEPVGYVTNLTLNGTITVNVDFSVTGVVADHIVPLVGYGTLSGTPTLVRGAIGGAEDADWVVVNNTSVKQIQLVPSTMTWSSSGGMLSLSWPLLGTIVQSNSVSVADPGSWFDIPATVSVTIWNVTPDPAKTNVFYRLRFP